MGVDTVMSINWKVVAFGVAAFVVIAGTNAGQFALWKQSEKKVKAQYDEKVIVLQSTIDAIGPTTGVWVVKEGNTAIFAGKEITIEDLEIREVPVSFLNDTYILDPSEVVGNYYKVALQPGSPLLQDLVMRTPMDDTTRYYDIVTSLLPVGIKVGDYVDLRLVYPLGEDYIVLSHKRIEELNARTVKVKLDETEINMYQGSLVDHYLQKEQGSQMYLTEYVEPGVQKEAERYYAVPKNILAVITANPNIVEKLNATLNNATRGIIDKSMKDITDEIGQKINSGRNDQSSKINEGVTEVENKRQEVQDSLGVVNPNSDVIVESTPNYSEVTEPSNTSPLYIQEGVVE